MRDVTIIIPSYNRAHLIAETLNGFLDQTIKPRELIVVDDGSTDNTRQVVEAFGPPVRYVRKSNGGKSSAINFVIPLIQSEFVWIFDDDDVAHPEALETLLATLDASPELSFAYGLYDKGISGPDGTLIQTARAVVPQQVNADVHVQRLNLYRYSFFMLSGCLIRSTALRAAGTFDEELLRSQDYDMCIRLARGGDFAFCGRSVYTVRDHAGPRGPAVISHAATEKRFVWSRYDNVIGKKLLSDTPLQDFYHDPGSYLDNDPQHRREALVRRAWVAASKSCMKTVFDDLSSAARLDPTARLSKLERELCDSIADHPYFMLALFKQPAISLRFARLSREPGGREILDCLARSIYRAAKAHEQDLSSLKRSIASVLGLLLYAINRARWRRRMPSTTSGAN